MNVRIYPETTKNIIKNDFTTTHKIYSTVLIRAYLFLHVARRYYGDNRPRSIGKGGRRGLCSSLEFRYFCLHPKQTP